MRATDFEFHHQLLLHELIVGAAVLTYLVERDDIVWRFIKNSGSDVRLFERLLFAGATLLLGVSAWICTLARAYQKFEDSARPAKLNARQQSRALNRLRYLGEFLFAVALGSLLPLAGFLVLVVVEAIRLLRLYKRDRASDTSLIATTPVTPKLAASAKESRP